MAHAAGKHMTAAASLGVGRWDQSGLIGCGVGV